MTPEEFLANFEALSDSLDGHNKLRELILELATSGRLVPQIASDDSAEISIRRKRENRRRIWLELHGRKPYPEPSSIPADEMPPLPCGWAWEKIEYLGADPFAAVQTGPFGAQLHKTEFVASGVPVIAVGNVGELSFKNDGRFYITQEKAEALNRYDIRAGDLLFARTGSVGKVCVAPDYVDDWRMTGHILRLRLDTNIALPWFIAFTLRGSKFVRTQVEDGVKGTTRPGFNTTLLERIVVPVPPISEQKRIITRVNQLMALCDELERQQAKKHETGTRLTRSALDALTSAEGPEEFMAAWGRVADNFDTLFGNSESIEGLRQTILELAVRGILERQEPTDAPASKLLAAIAASQKTTSKARKTSGQQEGTNLNGISRFPIPDSWSWGSIADVVEPNQPISYGVLVPGPDVENGIPFVRVQDLSVRNPPLLPSKRIAASVEEKYARTRLVGGELLLGVVGSIGRVGIAPKTWNGANIARAVCRIMPHHLVDSAFLAILLQSSFLQSYFKETTRTLAQPTLNVAMIRNAPVPLPPIAEQKRIVAKVDQLMALCDELKAKLRNAEKGAQRLAEAMTAAMVA